MGTDIHCHIEIKIEGRWEHYSNPIILRNYEMFGWLAGVRGPELQKITPLALPEDINTVTRYHLEMYRESRHNSGCLNHEQMVAWIKEFTEELDEGHHPGLGYFYDNSWRYIPKGIEDVRMIFFFDN